MSKKPVLIDILKRGDRQNVQEMCFNRHFREKRPSKCLRNEF
jgi:hypothetical protein